MRALDIVMKRREGEPLSREDISFLIRGYVDGSIPAYQTAALMSGRSLGHTDGIDWSPDAMIIDELSAP